MGRPRIHPLNPFGEVLNNILKSKTISPTSLAIASGLSKQTISNMCVVGSFKLTRNNVLQCLKGLIDLGAIEEKDDANYLLEVVEFETLNAGNGRDRDVIKLLNQVQEQAQAEREQALKKPTYTTSGGIPVIGRDIVIQKILDRVIIEPFVVLSGAQGVGKSEVARQVRMEARRREIFDYVERIPIGINTSTADAIKNIHQQLRRSKPHTRILLSIDNYEQLPGIRKELDELLETHKQLRILATSSVRVSLLDESIKSLEANDAVQLFLTAAKNLTPTEENAPKITELCIGLDGLPLALLLAAGLLIHETFDLVHTWVKENRLLDAENFFSEDEQHKTTLNALFERHYGLLKPNEQRLFRRLSIFADKCNIIAVAAVCIIENDLPEQEQQLSNLLRRLANHYLITNEAGRVKIAHNTVCSFAWQKLQEAKVKEDITEDMQIMEQFIDYYNTLICNYINTKFAEQEDQEAFEKIYELLIRDVKNLHYAYELMLDIRHQFHVRAIAKFIADNEDIEFRVVVNPGEEVDDLELISRVAREEDGFILFKVQKLLGNPDKRDYLTKDEIDELNKWLEKGMIAPYATWVLWEFFMVWEVRLKNVVYWTD